MLFFYIDESYSAEFEPDGYRYCYTGGIIIESERLVDVEVALSEVIWQADKPRDIGKGLKNPVLPNLAFSFKEFYRDILNDDEKAALFQKLIAVLMTHDAEFLVNGLKITQPMLTKCADLYALTRRTENYELQNRTFAEIPFMLEPWTKDTVVQMVVDLGLEQSFLKDIYPLYVAPAVNMHAVAATGSPDGFIALNYWRRLPVATFLDSESSRLMQMADVVVGALRCAARGNLTPYKQRMVECIEPIRDKLEMEEHTIE